MLHVNDSQGMPSDSFLTNMSLHSFHAFIAGVSSIETDVDAKSVVVQADENVSPQLMLEKLEKVRKGWTIDHSSEIDVKPALTICKL
jgi:hypothetical protein